MALKAMCLHPILFHDAGTSVENALLKRQWRMQTLCCPTPLCRFKKSAYLVTGSYGRSKIAVRDGMRIVAIVSSHALNCHANLYVTSMKIIVTAHAI